MSKIKADGSLPLTLQEALLWVATRDKAFLNRGAVSTAKANRLALELAFWSQRDGQEGLTITAAADALAQACRSSDISTSGIDHNEKRVLITRVDWIDYHVNLTRMSVENHNNQLTKVCFSQAAICDRFPPIGSVKPRSGAKEKYDWDEGKRIAFAELNKRGDFDAPENREKGWRGQNDLVRLLQRALKDGDDEPAESTTKAHVSQWLQEWRNGQH